jgi:hypothetical protein
LLRKQYPRTLLHDGSSFFCRQARSPIYLSQFLTPKFE